MCLPGTVETVRAQTAQTRTRFDRRTALLGAVGAAAAATFPASARAVRPAKGRFQDLTHVFTEGFPVFTGDTPTRETSSRSS